MWTLAQAEGYLNQLESLEVSNPGMWTLSQTQAYLDGLGVSTHPTGLEYPNVYADVRTSDGRGPTTGTRPGMRDGRICGQCRSSTAPLRRRGRVPPGPSSSLCVVQIDSEGQRASGLHPWVVESTGRPALALGRGFVPAQIPAGIGLSLPRSQCCKDL
jgi:hypothetical protein